MATVIGVKFRTAQKIYYFDPAGEEFRDGDGVILESQRGVEYARAVFGNKEVDESEIVAPLKPVLRKATPKDAEQNERNLGERDRLIRDAKRKVGEHGLPMKIVDAEYTFDRAKVIIYFTAESRIDFRELVRDLAGLFHNRIELRQIYERDDIKLRGALAPCGRPCCCTTFLQDYEKVSIKMAKYQGLSLNPSKISGCCGKLMCCLRYENNYYQDMYKKMPKVNSQVDTPDGRGAVAENDALRAEVKVKFLADDGGISFKRYPLDKIRALGKHSTRREEAEESDEEGDEE